MCVCPVPVEWRLTESLFVVSGSWETSGGSPMSIALSGSRNPTDLLRTLDSSGGLDASLAGPAAGDGVVEASVTTATWKRL